MADDDLSRLDEWMGQVTHGLTPPEPKRTSQKLGRELRKSNLKRIADNVQPDGTPMELESRSRYHQAVTLVAEGELDRAALAALPGVAGVEDNAEGSLTLLAAPGQVIFPQVNELIRQRGWHVKELDVERGRLDEVFRSLTRGEAA